MHGLNGLTNARLAADLGAGLTNFSRLSRHFYNAATFPNVVADGFFNINIFPVLHGPNGHQGVPMIRGGDANRIYFAIFQKFADVLVIFGRFSRLFFHGFHRLAND